MTDQINGRDGDTHMKGIPLLLFHITTSYAIEKVKEKFVSGAIIMMTVIFLLHT